MGAAAHMAAGLWTCADHMRLLLLGLGKAAHMAAAHMLCVKALGQSVETMLWNLKEPMCRVAGASMTVGLHPKQQVPDGGGSRVPGVI